MKSVYLIRSLSSPSRTYVGLCDDFHARLAEHNAGKSHYTRIFKPWRPVVAVQFEDDRRAAAFERYLKSGSGHAFARRHFW